ncbi:MAG: glycosyltransferase [Candidatus Krumholzibacteriia bacterium]
MTVRPSGPVPDVSIVIPVFNKLELTRACIASIWAQAEAASFEILVVDNGSTDGTAAWLATAEADGLLRAVPAGGNLGFSRGCNLGASRARGRTVLFLNNDMEVLPGWLDPLVWTLDADPDVGIVGARLLFPDGTIQHAGVAMVDYAQDVPPIMGGQHKSYRRPHDDPEVLRPQVLQVVTGACLLIRPELFAALGGFDDAYWNGNEDVDLCLRAGEAGWLVVYRPESTVIHYESQSGPERFARMEPNIAHFNAVWRGRARPDFVKRDGIFHDSPHNAIRLYAPPRQRHTGRRRTWAPAPVATVIVCPGGSPRERRQALAALDRHTDRRHAVVLLDDGNGDADLAAALADFRHARPGTTVRPGDGPAAVNAALAAATGEAMVLLAGDARVSCGWLETLLAGLGADGRLGLVGPLTNRPAVGQALGTDDAVAAAADPDAFAAGLAAREQGRAVPASQLAGFCLALRRTLVERIGGLDPAYGGLDAAAIDLCLRATLGGLRSAVVRGAYVAVPTRASAPDERAQEQADTARLCAKWPLAQTRDQDLQALLARGFLPPLHFVPLPAGPGLVPVAAAAWEAERWRDAGEESFAAGRYGEAVKLLRAAVAVRPADPRAANDLAVALLHLDPDGRGRDLARAILQAVLARHPDDADAAWNLRELAAVEAG